MLATLTSDVGRIFSKMHLVQPKGNINIITGVRIAHVSFINHIVQLIRSKSNYFFNFIDCVTVGVETSSG